MVEILKSENEEAERRESLASNFLLRREIAEEIIDRWHRGNCQTSQIPMCRGGALWFKTMCYWNIKSYTFSRAWEWVSKRMSTVEGMSEASSAMRAVWSEQCRASKWMNGMSIMQASDKTNCLRGSLILLSRFLCDLHHCAVAKCKCKCKCVSTGCYIGRKRKKEQLSVWLDRITSESSKGSHPFLRFSFTSGGLSYLERWRDPSAARLFIKFVTITILTWVIMLTLQWFPWLLQIYANLTCWLHWSYFDQF